MNEEPEEAPPAATTIKEGEEVKKEEPEEAVATTTLKNEEVEVKKEELEEAAAPVSISAEQEEGEKAATATTPTKENEDKKAAEPEEEAAATATSNDPENDQEAAEPSPSEQQQQEPPQQQQQPRRLNHLPVIENSDLNNIDFVRTQENRVKLYVLIEQRTWDDKGTGHVACIRSPKKLDEWYLVVRLENDERNILESRILESNNYQRQQGTLIVWPDSETVDLALSFQDKKGCEEIFNQISKIQKNCEDLDDDQGSDSADSNGWGQTISLPPCDIAHVSELENLISSSMSSQNTREVMANSLLRGDFLSKFCDMFEMVEDLEDHSTLQSMAAIAKDMFMLSSQALLHELISERNFRHFIGMLEYDSSVRKPKKHRQFLFEQAKFREALPITCPELREKITETYRLQYIHDVCLPAPSIFEENLLTTLSSTIFFNRIEICSKLMSDKTLIKQLFSELKDKNISSQRQKDLAGFLKEFVTCAQALQPSASQGKEAFFKMMMENDVYQILDPCLSSSIHLTQSISVELLSLIVDFSLGPFRQYLMKQQAPDEDSLLINKMIRYLVCDRDPEFTNARNMAEIIRIILDPDAQPRNDCEIFFQFFYEKSMPVMIKPIIDCISADGSLARDDFYTSRQFCMILTMLIFCIKNHTQLMRSYIIKNDLLTSICVFLQSKHHLSVIKVVRLIRRILDLRDEVYHRYIRDKKLFKPIVDAFNANGSRYNLLNSTILDLFEFVQQDNIVTLIDYIGAEYLNELEHHSYVKTFQTFRRKYEKRREDETRRAEQQQQRTLPSPSKQLPERLMSQYEREKRSEDEEVFFNGEDDDNGKLENGIAEDEQPSSSTKANANNAATPMRKSGAEINFPSIGAKRKNTDDEGVASIFGGTASTPSISKPGKITIKIGGNISTSQSPSPSSEAKEEDAPIKTILNPRYRRSSLVTYDDSDDEEDKEDSNGKSKSAPPSVSSVSQPPKKKIKVLHYSPVF